MVAMNYLESSREREELLVEHRHGGGFPANLQMQVHAENQSCLIQVGEKKG